MVPSGAGMSEASIADCGQRSKGQRGPDDEPREMERQTRNPTGGFRALRSVSRLSCSKRPRPGTPGGRAPKSPHEQTSPFGLGPVPSRLQPALCSERGALAPRWLTPRDHDPMARIFPLPRASRRTGRRGTDLPPAPSHRKGDEEGDDEEGDDGAALGCGDPRRGSPFPVGFRGVQL
jgi:hypothetical protein